MRQEGFGAHRRPLRGYLVITALGIDKDKDMNFKQEEIDRVKQAVRDLTSRPDPTALGSRSGATGSFCLSPSPIFSPGTGACTSVYNCFSSGSGESALARGE